MMRICINVGESSFELGPGETVLGRDLNCQLRLADLRVSRRHLRFRVAEQGASVEDLGSSNGTRVNEQWLAGVRLLRDGDVIDLGGPKLRVSVDQGVEVRQAARTLTSLDEINGVEMADGVIPVVTADTSAPEYHYWRSEVGERRRHARTPARINVLYDSETLNLDAVARDVSDGGLFLVTELLDQVGTSCTMTIALRGSRPFRARGVVRHVVTSASKHDDHPPGMGVQFTELQGLAS